MQHTFALGSHYMNGIKRQAIKQNLFLFFNSNVFSDDDNLTIIFAKSNCYYVIVHLSREKNSLFSMNIKKCILI